MSTRIAWQEGNMNLELEENKVLVITIENTMMYIKFISDLSAQSKGEPGLVCLSKDDKAISISRSAEVIFNPFSIDINNKKVITKLYQELRNISDGTFQEQQYKINADIIEYLDILTNHCTYYLNYDLQIEPEALFKLYNVKLVDHTDSFLEQLIHYLRVMNQLGGIHNFFFINLKDYLEENELEVLYEFARYEKIDLILLETRKTTHQKYEKHWILDKDRCIIEPDELTM